MDNTPCWEPQQVKTTALFKFLNHIEQRYNLHFEHYQAFHQWSIDHAEDFWRELSVYVPLGLNTPPTHIFSSEKPDAPWVDGQWFEGATLNVAASLLQHAKIHPDKTALIAYHEQCSVQRISWRALEAAVHACRAGMQAWGVQPYDRVVGIVCHDHHAIIAMLAATSLGAIWSACSPDFGLEALYERFSQIEPVLLFATPYYTYQGKAWDIDQKIQALRAQLPSVRQVIYCGLDVASPTPSGTLAWHDFLGDDTPTPFKPFPFDHPLYILFSSGTTGLPKCILHRAGGTLLQHLKELQLHTNLNAQDTLLFYTTCSWMMWHWSISALALGTSLVLYHGDPIFPDPQYLLSILDQEAVTVFGTSASYLARLEQEGIHRQHPTSLQSLRTLLSTGSPLFPEQYDYVQQAISPTVQISSISGGTDIIACFALGNPMTPVYRGEIQSLGLGMAVAIFDVQGHPLSEGVGELVCTQPFPSMPLGFWHDHHHERYLSSYFKRFPHVWTHGDFAEITTHGGLIIHGRSDTTLNRGGVRIGTAEIYRPLEHIKALETCVVIEQENENGSSLMLFVKLIPPATLTPELISDIQKRLRFEASPRHVPDKIIAVPDIPKTRHGKITELAVKQILHGQEVLQKNTLANPESLEYFKPYARRPVHSP